MMAVEMDQLGARPPLPLWVLVEDDGVDPPDEEWANTLHMVRAAAASFGAQMLKASDPDDLQDRLDAIAMDPNFLEFSFAAATMLGSYVFEQADAQSGIPQTLAKVIGAEATAILGGGVDLFRELLRACSQVLAAAEKQQRHEGKRRPGRGAWNDPLTPPQVQRAVLEEHKATAAVMALAAMVRAEKCPPKWLGDALAEQVVQGHREFLRLLASIPPIEVSEKIIPKSERIDMAGLYKQAKVVEQRFQTLVAEAEESGAKVYPPLEARDVD